MLDLAAGEALAELQRRTGAQFPNLTAARATTAAELPARSRPGSAYAEPGLSSPLG